MSTLKVEVKAIDEIMPHPNADKLELARFSGWTCVVGKGVYKAGDKVVYFPIDSVLPHDVESKIFPPGSKVKLNNSRVRTIKLRGAISQGLAANPALFGLENTPVGTDVTTLLKVTKFEPEIRPGYGNLYVATSKKTTNTNFKKYTDLENVKNYTEVFTPDDFVVATEKIHGTNFRCGYVRRETTNPVLRFLELIGLRSKYEFVYGSRNMQLSVKALDEAPETQNVYARIVNQYELQDTLQDGEVIYGEIYGDKIQKNYNYGCEPGVQKLAVFDLQKDGKYQSVDQLACFLVDSGLPGTPELYRGFYDYEKLKALTLGNSVLAPEQKVREGLVVRPLIEEDVYMRRKILKFISDEYLLDDDNTDFH